MYFYGSVVKGRREISAKELADLTTNWLNPTVDTRYYYQCAMVAWEVGQPTFEKWRKEGGLCQEQDGKYYIS